jgi:serine/threonine protein kinase
LRLSPQDDGLSCVVTPLMEGGDLERRLASEPSLRADERLQIAADCAEGLKALHALKFVHRDLKPANVLLTADMRAVRAPAQSAASSHPTPGTDAA